MKYCSPLSIFGNVYTLSALTCVTVRQHTGQTEFSEHRMHQAKLFNLSEVNQIDVLEKLHWERHSCSNLS